MKRLASIVLVIVAIFAIAPWTIMAQTQNDQDVYTVQPGDTGWELARVYYNDPALWRFIVELNPMLREPGRLFERDGKIILILRPGEQLTGFERMKIRWGVEPPVAVPIEKLVAPPVFAPERANVGTIETAANTGINWWKWGVIAFFVLAGALAFRDWLRRRREMGLNPVTSAPPIVAGGVHPNETARLTRTMETAAVSEYVRMNPGIERHAVHVERIGPIDEGTISGEGMVGYADRARPRRINPPQPGYRARFRFPDGREDFLMSLQGCMNPCYFGEGLSGFRFEPRQEVVPAPEPARPAPQAVPHPAVLARSIRNAAEGDGRTTITVGGQVFVFDRGAHLSVDDATGAIGLEGQAFSMTIKPKRTRRKKPAAPRATGTTGDAS